MLKTKIRLACFGTISRPPPRPGEMKSRHKKMADDNNNNSNKNKSKSQSKRRENKIENLEI